jgi:ornithine cyclodeaminase/alanine dehydrogenase-like protein (mu-crystallin family)
VELKNVLGSKPRIGGRSLFKSLGTALEDVATGSVICDRAVRCGDVGTTVELGWPGSS